VIHRGGSVALNAGSTNYKARSAYKDKLYDFKFWRAHVGVDLDPQNDWSIDSLDKPSFKANKRYYWITPTSGEASLAADWQVISGESYIIFIDGDLRLNHNITVASGGFLAMIVKGKVTVDPGATQLEGIYLIDETFTTNSATSGDDQL